MQVSPIIYTRTYDCDYNLVIKPQGIPKDDLVILQKYISYANTAIDFLKGERWVVVDISKYRLIGVVGILQDIFNNCKVLSYDVKRKSEHLFRDCSGRLIPSFIGIVIKDFKSDENSIIPTYDYFWNIFFENIEPIFDEKSCNSIEKEFDSEKYDLNSILTINRGFDISSQKFEKFDDKKIYSSDSQSDYELFKYFVNSKEKNFSFCSNISRVDSVFRSIFKIITVPFDFDEIREKEIEKELEKQKQEEAKRKIEEENGKKIEEEKRKQEEQIRQEAEREAKRREYKQKLDEEQFKKKAEREERRKKEEEEYKKEQLRIENKRKEQEAKRKDEEEAKKKAEEEAEEEKRQQEEQIYIYERERKQEEEERKKQKKQYEDIAVAMGFGFAFLVALLTFAGSLYFNDSKKRKLKEKIKIITSNIYEIRKNADKTGKLYSSVTSQDIANAVTKKTKISISKENIIIDLPITQLGDYIVKLKIDAKEIELRIAVIALEENYY